MGEEEIQQKTPMVYSSNKNDILEQILRELENSGSTIPYLYELRDKALFATRRDRPLSEVLSDIATDIETETKLFLLRKNDYDVDLITGISTGIYLPDKKDGSYKLKILGGKKSRFSDEKVNVSTVFDLASISKMYTLVLLFKLEELGYINLDDKIRDVDPSYEALKDFTFNDLIRLRGVIKTKGRIDQATSYDEAYDLLRTAYLEDGTENEQHYTDIGAMIMADVVEKIISEALGKHMTFDEIMNEFLFKPLFINNTTFTPSIVNVSGNGRTDALPHDPKARVLGRPSGHAGIFSDSEGLEQLAEGLIVNGYLNQEHLDRMSEKLFSSKGSLGAYVKHPEGLKGTYTPSELSSKSWAFQGWTGQIAVFDPVNAIHHNMLLNAIYDSAEKDSVVNNKPLGFSTGIREYQGKVIEHILLMYVVKKYYNRYMNVKEDIEEMRLV